MLSVVIKSVGQQDTNPDSRRVGVRDGAIFIDVRNDGEMIVQFTTPMSDWLKATAFLKGMRTMVRITGQPIDQLEVDENIDPTIVAWLRVAAGQPAEATVAS